jgi:hypothetical protein
MVVSCEEFGDLGYEWIAVGISGGLRMVVWS